MNINDNCSICLDSINNNNNTILLKDCNHIFHYDCIKKWIVEKDIESSCPLCKKKINNILINKKQSLFDFLNKTNIISNYNQNQIYIKLCKNILRFGYNLFRCFTIYCRIKFYIFLLNKIPFYIFLPLLTIFIYYY